MSFYVWDQDEDAASMWAWRWQLFVASWHENRLRRRLEAGDLDCEGPYTLARYKRRRIEARRPC